MQASQLDWKSPKSKAFIALVCLGVLIPTISNAVSANTYPSLEKAEEACIAWQQSGNVHQSLTDEEAWSIYGREVGQGSCDFVRPSLTRRFSKQMQGKELVKSRYCINNKATNTIEGRRNAAMEQGLKESNSAYTTEKTFKY